MNDGRQHSLKSARAAAEGDELAGWVAGFLASPGSDNPVLAKMLPEELGWWAGPVQLPIDELHRLAGPAGDPVLCPVDKATGTIGSRPWTSSPRRAGSHRR